MSVDAKTVKVHEKTGSMMDCKRVLVETETVIRKQ